jgi:hypothetical protein
VETNSSGRVFWVGRVRGSDKEKFGELTKRLHGAESWTVEAVEEMEKDRAMRVLETGARVLGYRAGEKAGGGSAHPGRLGARKEPGVGGVGWRNDLD